MGFVYPQLMCFTLWCSGACVLTTMQTYEVLRAATLCRRLLIMRCPAGFCRLSRWRCLSQAALPRG